RHTRWPRDWSSDVCSSDLLLEVVGADLLAPVARADLALAVAGDGLLLLGQRHLVQPRPQHLHGLLAVLDLALLVLAGDDGVGGRSEERRVGKEWGCWGGGV